jgi:hypothetical protein
MTEMTKSSCESLTPFVVVVFRAQRRLAEEWCQPMAMHASAFDRDSTRSRVSCRPTY